VGNSRFQSWKTSYNLLPSTSRASSFSVCDGSSRWTCLNANYCTIRKSARISCLRCPYMVNIHIRFQRLFLYGINLYVSPNISGEHNGSINILYTKEWSTAFIRYCGKHRYKALVCPELPYGREILIAGTDKKIFVIARNGWLLERLMCVYHFGNPEEGDSCGRLKPITTGKAGNVGRFS
jgi:hypothetical protein